MLVTGSRQNTTIAGVDDEEDAGDGEAGSESAGKSAHLRPTLRPVAGSRHPPYGCRLPAATTSHSSSIVAEARMASARLAASGIPPSPIRRTNQAGASTPKPPGPASSAITAAGPSQPASTTAARAAAPRRAVSGQQQPEVQGGDHEHEQIGIAREGETLRRRAARQCAPR